MLKIRLTQAAEQHLQDICFYTLSEQGITQLLDNPYIGKTRPEIKKDLKSLQIQKHLIFYRVGTEYIDIIGLLHSRMDTGKWLNEK